MSCHWRIDQFLHFLEDGKVEDRQSPFWHRNFNLVIDKAVANPFLHFITYFQVVFLLAPHRKQQFNRRFTERSNGDGRFRVGQNQWILIGNVSRTSRTLIISSWKLIAKVIGIRRIGNFDRFCTGARISCSFGNRT